MAGENTGGRGGRIPSDGRAPKAPAVGAQARRHDLERPATPGLANSDLQQGDVSKLEAGQRVAPIKNQASAPGNATTSQPQGQTAGSSGGIDVPDPLAFAQQRLSNTLGAASGPLLQAVDPTPWVPFLKALATHPNAGASLTQAYVTQLSNLINRPSHQRQVDVSMTELDAAVAESIRE